jgi:ArsR family transcriptional regulator, lead/cadmium/zinc/bismuth-responsive transcriptional repressor
MRTTLSSHPHDASEQARTLHAERCLVPGMDSERVAKAEAALLDDDVYVEIAETFRALADSTRVKIVYSLLHQELCTCDLAAVVGTSESAVSQHLRVLRQLRLIKNRRDGKMVFHSLNDTHIHILLNVCFSHVLDVERQHEGLEQVLEFFGSQPHINIQGGRV